MEGVSQRAEWILSRVKDIANDKEYIIKNSILNMLNRTLMMFEYEGLPETIKVKDLETILQVGGYAIWKEVDGELYAFSGFLGGKPNPYYLPTIATIANPALNYSDNLEIGTECVVMLNDYMYNGLMPIFNKYASQLANSEISLWYALLNARIPALIQADNDTARESAEEFIRQVTEGKNYGIIASNGMFEGIKTQDFLKQTHIKELIEGIQYIKGSWFNELGLTAAFNMKREAINEFEAGLNDDILVPLIDCMLMCRQAGLDEVNKMYGKNIKVKLASIWKENREDDAKANEHRQAEIDLLKAEAKDTIADAETKEESEVIDDEDNGNAETESSD